MAGAFAMIELYLPTDVSISFTLVMLNTWLRLQILAIVLFVTMLVALRMADYSPVAARAIKDDKNSYQDDVVRAGVIATVFWGLAGFLAGVLIAAQLAWPE